MIPEWPWWKRTWAYLFCLFIVAEVITVAFGLVPTSRLVFCGFAILVFINIGANLERQRHIRRHNDELRAHWDAVRPGEWVSREPEPEPKHDVPFRVVRIRKVDDHDE